MVQAPVTAGPTDAAGSAADAAGFAACTVSEVRPDTDAVVLTLTPPEGIDLPFVHGQHLVFRREIDGVEIRRSYSLCSPAGGPLQVAVRLVPGGAFSTWANTELAIGDTVDVLAPSGRFTHELDPSAARRYLLVAGGSGITPILSIAATVLASEPEARVTLLYVNSSTATTMLLDEVEALRNRFLGRFDLWYAFTREATALDLLDGRPDAERFVALTERGILPTMPDLVFLCGPEGLVEAATEGLTMVGADPSAIHAELFSAGEGRLARPAPRVVADDAEPVATASLRLHGRTTEVPLFDGDTVLEAAQRVRPDVPYSCRAGVCSTCRAHLDVGEVTMDISHGLDPSEVDAGYVLTCRAVPTTPEVTVDYDA